MRWWRTRAATAWMPCSAWCRRRGPRSRARPATACRRTWTRSRAGSSAPELRAAPPEPRLRYRGRMSTDVRKGQAPPTHTREEFGKRFRARFFDPVFQPEQEAIARLEEIAWQGYDQGRKAPVTRKAGPEFEDP